jgi:hypothetical protein
MDDALEPERLYFESGASWYWALAGPVSALAMIGIQLWSGMGVQWVVPVAFLVLVSGFVSLQVKAARIHTSVELTREWLRQGAQTIGVHEIVKVYPEPKNPSRSHYDGRLLKKNNALTNRALRQSGLGAADLEDSAALEERIAADTDRATVEKWQSSRALGELTGVPRGRTGIGIRLTGGRTAQAWARNHRALRAALTPLVEERSDPGGLR